MKFFAVALFSVFVFLNCTNGFSQSGKADSDPDRNKKANQRPAPTPTPEPIVLDTGEVDESEVIKFDTELVTVPVRILDRKGRSVIGLKQENFQIFEDGKQQEIAYFSNERKSFTVALVLDMSFSGINNIEEIQQAAIAFVAQLQGNDRVMVVSFDGKVNILTEPISDRKELYRAIKTTRISASGTSVYDAMDIVVKKLEKIGGQKALVLFSDGVDTTSEQVTARDNLRDVLELDVIIYPIKYDTYANVQKVLNGEIAGPPPPNTSPIPGKNPTGLPGILPTILGGGGVRSPRGNDPNRDRTNDPNEDGSGFPSMRPIGRQEPGTSREEYRFAGEYLDGLANRTGGRLYEARATGDLALAFSKIAAELREFYSIGYYPPEDGEKDKLRKIKVKVDQKDVAVKARDGYVAKKK